MRTAVLRRVRAIKDPGVTRLGCRIPDGYLTNRLPTGSASPRRFAPKLINGNRLPLVLRIARW